MRIQYEVHVCAHPEQAEILTGFETPEEAAKAAADIGGVVVERQVLEL